MKKGLGYKIALIDLLQVHLQYISW